MNKNNNEKVESNVCPICGRILHKKSKYCTFHASAKEKTEKEFIEALKKYIQEIKEENKDCNFGGFIFIGEIDFKEDLNITIFKEANFLKAIFEGDTSFWGATFEGYADFREVIFKRDAIFWKATFKGDTDFIGVTFEGDIDFSGATFEGDIDFKVKYFVKGINFSRVSILSVKKLNLKSGNNEGIISFERAYLENAYLDIELDKGVLIDFGDALLKNTKIKKRQIENYILQEKKEEFSKASEIYLLLKNNFHSIGRYDDESWAFKKEKDMERKSNCHFKTLHKWLWSCFLNGLFGYGEQPVKVIISAMSIILIFTFLFMSSGISDTSIGGFTSKYFLDCIYFSTVTFTTLGYGDFRPLEGWGRIFAGTEAFIGAFMMALFVYTFARKTGGR